MGIEREEICKPHRDEIIVPVQSGDVVFSHAAVYHSGTPNYSGHPRYFCSLYYNKSWLKCRDDHEGPAVRTIVAAARANEDRRLLRWFGELGDGWPVCGLIHRQQVPHEILDRH
jgi:ectoine hydroxylase-related dioxygenase (phytanoyl-CoA dioxygenase family)